VTAFPAAARRELANVQLRTNLRNATDTIRAKRARVVEELPDWEELRDAGRAIKTDVLARLDDYLLQFEAAVEAAGGRVHWARDAAEANAVVVDVARAHGVDEVVKMKSLTTDEIRLNDALDTERSRPGDRFVGALDSPVAAGGREVLPKGTAVEGHIADTGFRNGRVMLALALDRYQLDGRSFPLSSIPVTRTVAAKRIFVPANSLVGFTLKQSIAE